MTVKTVVLMFLAIPILAIILPVVLSAMDGIVGCIFFIVALFATLVLGRRC